MKLLIKKTSLIKKEPEGFEILDVLIGGEKIEEIGHNIFSPEAFLETTEKPWR